MNIKNDIESENNIPVFATTAGAACYKVGDQGFLDLMFMRSHFVVDDSAQVVDIDGDAQMQQQPAHLVFTRVAAVTMTAGQAKDLISAIEHQLQSLAQK